MRLSKQEIEVITSVVHRFARNAEIYLFGSRTRDDARGGDIDLLLLADERIDLHTIIQMKIAIQDILGEQKIDIISQQHGSLTPFGRLAKMDGMRL
jgi:predicted nucleotidyltransferase